MALPRALFTRLVPGGVVLLAAASHYYGVSPLTLATQGGRAAAVRALAVTLAGDRAEAEQLRRDYYIGSAPRGEEACAGWRAAEAEVPGFQVLAQRGEKVPRQVPFVYQRMDEPHLAELREECRLGSVAGGGREFDRMLRLFHWVGTRWDHGMDTLPDGTSQFHPLKAVRAAERGAKFPCDFAATLAVHAASSLGWPARLVTLSRDGYRWEHAVAEVWSNQFGKWFVVDCDYNIIYESQGVPLSAFELCHLGPRLLAQGRLDVRRIAPDKPSVPRQDLMPYYAYVHIDLRNDWLRRSLKRGSPEGGDLATYWTSRPELSQLLTAKVRVDEGKRFDWPVNGVELRFRGVERTAPRPTLLVEPYGYSPYFRCFAYSIDHGAWLESAAGILKIPLDRGVHSLRARVVTSGGDSGPPCEIRYRYDGISRQKAAAP